MQLSTTHLTILNAAALRDDKLLARPGKLGSKAAEKLVTRFVAAGVVQVMTVTSDQPHWHVDERGEPIGLQVTRAGLDVLGIEPDVTEASASAASAGDAADPISDEATEQN